jgi:HK97 gp10 family phage protein
MAGIEADEFGALVKMLESIPEEAVPAAQDAAAEVFKAAAIAAAPVESGQLKGSIKIFKSKNRNLTGREFTRVLIGPEKKKGYYGFFLEKGWTATGPKRRGRKATKSAHSQRGVSGGRKIPDKPWFEPAMRQAEARAEQAAESAFEAKLRQKDSET